MTNRTEDVWYLDAFFLIQWAPLENFWQWTWKWWFWPQSNWSHPWAFRDTEILVNSGVRSPVTDFLSRCNPLAKTSFTTCGVYSQWPFLISRETVRWRINKRVWILHFFASKQLRTPWGAHKKKWWYEKNQHDEDVGPAWIHFPTACFLVQAFGWVPSSSQKVL